MLYDLAVLGGGPAGVSAGVYASRKKLKTVFIAAEFGGQSIVSEGVENWIGDINISGPELAKRLEAHLNAYAGDIVDIKKGEWVKKVTKSNDGFKIETDKETYEAKTVLVATGSDRRKLDIPGADKYEHKGITYCASCDGPLFSDQDVVIIGGGNAALESAAQLLAYTKSVTLLNRSDRLRGDEVTIEKITAHPKMTIIKNATPKEVKGEAMVTSIIYTDAGGKDVELATTGIFVEIGAIPTTEFIKDTVELTKYGQIVTDPRTQRASVDGVWSAGDCTDGLYHQNNIAAGDAVKALEDIYLYIHAK